uniref:Uncharacterized protein n=1 Tax=Physcomitrium patens TaxID=3218 RepID=A0A2K1L258_PHYPA|nr:hypothetical protein PHYPA_002907 [Physcomitrium patens]
MQNVIDRDEQNKLNFYKVNYMTAIYWSLVAWVGLSPTTIKNYFRHIRLFEQALEVAKIDNGEETIKEEVVGIIWILLLRNPISKKMVRILS